MASELDTLMADGELLMVQTLAEDGHTLTNFDGTAETINMVANELVGFVDELQRKIFTWLRDDTPATHDPVLRGFVITDESGEEWTIVDVRDDDLGFWEVRADRNLVET